MVLILVGKSGVGKDTILKELVARYGFTPIISDTDRPRRANEVDGVDYNFISPIEFSKRKYVEKRTYPTVVEGVIHEYHFGCPCLDYSNNSKQYAAVFDTIGAKEFMNVVGDDNVLVAHITAPEELCKQRAIARGSFTEEEWENRLADDNGRFTPEKLAPLYPTMFENGADGDITALAYKIQHWFYTSRSNR